MSDYHEARVTISVDGDERDVTVRGFVSVKPGLGMGGAWGAELDGDADIWIDRDWFPLDSVNLDEGDDERIEEALCNAALEDDRQVA